LANLAREDEEYLERTALLRCDALSAETPRGSRIAARDLASTLSGALAKRMIRILAQRERTTRGELTASHVEAIRNLARSGENGKVLQLPGGVDVRRNDDHLIFLKRASRDGKQSPGREFSRVVPLTGKEAHIVVEEIGCVIRIRSIDWPNAGRETINTGGAALDRNKLQDKLILRSLRPGDRMRPEGHQKAHKLKRLL